MTGKAKVDLSLMLLLLTQDVYAERHYTPKQRGTTLRLC